MSVQAEQSIICMAIRNNARMQDCDLEPYEFESWQNQEIFKVIQTLVNAGKVADLVTVVEALEDACPGQEFAPYLATLVEESWSINSFEQCCEIVRDDFRKMQAMEIAIGRGDDDLDIGHFAAAYAMNEACTAADNVFYAENYWLLKPDEVEEEEHPRRKKR